MENILNRIKLIMNYDSSLTLGENIEKINKFLISEDRGKQPILFLQNLLKLAPDAFDALKSEITLLNKFKSADEFTKELEQVAKTKQYNIIQPDDITQLARELGKKSKTIATKLEGVILNSKSFDEVVSKARNSPENLELVRNQYEQLGLNFDELVKRKNLPKLTQGNLPTVPNKNLMASDNSLKSLVKNPKTPKEVDYADYEVILTNIGKSPEELTKIKNTVIKYNDDGFNKLKGIRNKLSWKRAILYGLMGWGTYQAFKDLFSDESKISILPACVVNDKRIILTTDKSGNEVGVMLRGTGVEEYDKAGGLNFYPNNRVMTVDTKKRGTYACKTTEEIATESFNRIKINEEDIGNIQITWDTKSSGGGTDDGKKTFTWKESPSCDEVVNGSKTISIGMKGECVGKIQDQLRSKGFDEVGNTDNKFGKKTKSAVIRLQRNSKLTQNGVVDAATYNVLFFDTASPSVEEIKPKQPEIQSASQSSEPQLKPAPPLPTNTAPTNNQPQQSSDAETQNIDRKGIRRRGLFRRNRQ